MTPSKLKKPLRVAFLSDWFGSPYKKLLAEHLEQLNVEVTEYQQYRRFITTVLKDKKPHVVHIHSTIFNLFGNKDSQLLKWIRILQFVSQVILLRLLGVKTIWTIHEWADKHNRGNRDLSTWQYALLGQVFHSIIVHCKSTGNEVVKSLGIQNQSKLIVIPHGNFIDFYENTVDQIIAREKLGVPLNHTVFLFFGAISYHKGIIETLDAFNVVSEQKSEVSLLVAGKISHLEVNLEDNIHKRIINNKNIHLFPGKVSDEDVQLYMNACDCVVTPYRSFTTSGVALLAMSFGKAIIAPKRGFFSDSLSKEGAFLYDPFSNNSLIESFELAVENKNNLAKMGQHNLLIAKKLNWKTIADQSLEIYLG
ncbi:Glycosyltransferase type 1 [Halomicronema hongdechloris C2206]|uniref:Glycosyltransferase type 1 n=1 Tax=Halomicronema hongdechloris C2206 TaxID=1641165 RepID=A0A1Z3HMP0_9CYAN|nr:glycosyltransferase family 4 protein [Halomicronema hongdechloris]ASC71571.1 Glycosyltransferase type 1 [Halomicronema hongdechloris C2206]